MCLCVCVGGGGEGVRNAGCRIGGPGGRVTKVSRETFCFFSNLDLNSAKKCHVLFEWSLISLINKIMLQENCRNLGRELKLCYFTECAKDFDLCK